MKEFLNQVWLANPLKTYLAVLAVILFVWVFKRYISRYVAGVIFSIVNRIWTNLDKQPFIKLVMKPLGNFVFLLTAIIALYELKFPDEGTYTAGSDFEDQLVQLLNTDLYGHSVKTILHCIAIIILIVSFIRLLLRIVDFIAFLFEQKANLTVSQSDNQLVVFFRDFFKVLIGIIGVLMLLKFAFHFNISNMLTGLSIVGAAVALALRESLENLIASFIIFFDKPFTLGDLVKVQNITGRVERIGLRSTRIRTDQKTHVTVPNKQMVDSILDNLSQRTQIKGELRLQIALSTSSSALEQLLAGIKKILQHKEIENFNVFLNEIAINAFSINADYFTRPLTYAEFIKVKEEINLQVLKLMEALKIEIAGASTDIRIEGNLNEKRSSN